MEEEIIENSVQIIILGTLSMMTFIGGILAFILLYQRKVHKAAREKQALENEYQKELLNSFIETQEKERQRIAADLHDGVGASLSGIKLMLNQIKPQNEKEKEALLECTKAIQSTSGSVREISHDLLPPSLQTLGLVKVLERMAKNYSSKEFTIHFHSKLEFALDHKTELSIFRIAQEMLNNTLKHAKANEVVIQLTEDVSSVIFNYSDNGKGFETKHSEGLGLKNIKSRSQMINAKLHFFSEANTQSGLRLTISKNG